MRKEAMRSLVRGLIRGLAHRAVLAIFVAVSMSSAASGQASTQGQWGPVFKWPNVGIHVHLLPNGKVLFWGRRKEPKDDNNAPAKGLNFHDCVPWLWDPVSEVDFPSP